MNVSIALATCNGAQYLTEQLESILQQSRLPDEVVVSDDQSTDDTVPIIERFAQRAPFSVKLLPNTERVGFSDNFLRAMAACRGDLIAFCDQDDVWLPEKLARCEREFRRDLDVGLVAHTSRVVDSRLRSLGWSEPRIRRRRVIAAGGLTPFQYFRGMMIVFRARLIDGLPFHTRPPEPLRNSVPLGHDRWAALTCGSFGSVTLLPDTLALYRQHESNLSVIQRHPRAQRVSQLNAYREEVAQTLRPLAEAANQHLAYLSGLRSYAEQLGEHAVGGLERSITSYRRLAETTNRRAAAYAETNTVRRALRFGEHAFGGDYTARTRGGLGAVSLVRDLTVGLVLAPQATSAR